MLNIPVLILLLVLLVASWTSALLFQLGILSYLKKNLIDVACAVILYQIGISTTSKRFCAKLKQIKLHLRTNLRVYPTIRKPTGYEWRSFSRFLCVVAT